MYLHGKSKLSVRIIWFFKFFSFYISDETFELIYQASPVSSKQEHITEYVPTKFYFLNIFVLFFNLLSFQERKKLNWKEITKVQPPYLEGEKSRVYQIQSFLLLFFSFFFKWKYYVFIVGLLMIVLYIKFSIIFHRNCSFVCIQLPHYVHCRFVE